MVTGWVSRRGVKTRSYPLKLFGDATEQLFIASDALIAQPQQLLSVQQLVVKVSQFSLLALA